RDAIYFFIGLCFHADQDSTALESSFVDLRAIFRNARADQSADQSPCCSTRTSAREGSRDWTSNEEIDAGKKERCSHCRYRREHRANCSTDRAANSQSISSMRARLQRKLF